MIYTKDEIIKDLSERSFGTGKDQWMSIRCDMARDIVSLLKVKAKLLTLDGVKQSVGKELFLEVRTIDAYPAEKPVKVTVDSIHRDFVVFNDSTNSAHGYAFYNRASISGWRLWTSEPTEDEIAEAMWNG